MSTTLTTEQFAHRIEQCQLLDGPQISQVLSDVGGRDASIDDLSREFMQRELLTNWQIGRINEGHRYGYFYGKWKVLYLVGAGTFARVYRATHVDTNEMKAVKVLRKRYTDDPLTRERFEREARTVMKLRHPNIVPIHEVETHRNRLYMVMDFIEGQNLRDFVRAHKTLNVTTTLNIVRDICNGLKYAFNLGICHRDMKLSNILLSSSGRASIVDFGLAGVDDEIRANVFHPRSVDYAGLEKTTNVGRNDKRSDIFFLGCMTYQMLTGKPPMLETRERMRRMSPERYRDIEPITSLAPNLPRRVVLLVNHLLELNPDKRTQTPADALAETELVIEALKSGDADKVDANLSADDAARYTAAMQKKREGQNHTLMVIESNPKLQDALRTRLKKIGYRVLILSDPARAVERFHNLDAAEDLPADCVLFGCSGLGRVGFNAFKEFTENEETSHLPAILMVTDDQLEMIAEANLQSHHASIPLPIKFPVIRRTLRQLLNIDNGKAPA